MSFEPQEVLDNRARIVLEVRLALSEVFTEPGMQTVLYYLKLDYDTALDDVWRDPLKFTTNFVEFLGDFGGKLLLRRIEHRLSKVGWTIGPIRREKGPIPEA